MIYAALIVGWIATGLPAYFMIRSEFRRVRCPWTNGCRITFLPLAIVFGPMFTVVVTMQVILRKLEEHPREWWNKPARW